mgnify:CR=1 FL=1
MLKQFLEAGKVVGMHGVRGEMRFDVWCDGADFLKKIKTLYLDADGKRAVGVVSVRPHKNAALLKLDGVLTIEEAEKYRGRVLYFDRKDVHLDSGKAFVEDVIGCAVSVSSTVTETESGSSTSPLAICSRSSFN